MSIQQKLHLKLGQKLVMTPSLQQAIKLLPLARLELQTYLAQEMQVNPVLEEAVTQQEDEEYDAESEMKEAEEQAAEKEEKGKENGVNDTFDYEAFFRDYFDLSYTPFTSPEITEYPSFENTLVNPTSLSGHLEWQLGLSSPPEPINGIAREIIGNLDENGYLKVPLEEIAQANGYEMKDVEKALDIVQHLDPIGIGARDLKECLMIQVHHYGYTGTPVETIINEHLDLLRNHNYNELAKKLKCSMDDVELWVDHVKHLDPMPGLKFSSSRPQYVTPDVYVVKVDGDYKIILDDDGIPKLRINPIYRRMMDESNSPETIEYIKDKIKSALWLIKSIDQRQKTIYKVAESIVRHQRSFLDYGIEFLKPLILKTVAEDIGMHESTVSRAVTNKYMHTPQGVFEMKFFFHSSLSNSRGVDVSSLSIKERLKKIIEAENPGKPLSDSEITSIFQKEGLKISRRTIAKYREDMKIPPSHQRRSVVSQ
ncbi:RNA polymerase factor sigma-54 [bacterium]|nr:RNA polymerase factor sigma-54 [bacterium]MCI0616533.1 RNA polymerase factor sigma-54 [bacterium]